ncbi:6-hydroxytryprostatin B O-methyltransferase [Dichotomopilus funicola]|uniref:6-hydroxytryprostatin B O-methyltransferase n=1 Tax=Dichotomopilus funicola TaxID=1934379 RepID=A0AAN6UXJ7_9PEZI|nr:6-hydroxytryprostatin B O-methyltransferase [Dichotomopilus funicola]
MGSQANLSAMGAEVAVLATTVAAALEKGGHPQPSFAADSPATFPPDADIQQPRLRLIEVLTDLLYLATGAGDYLFLHGGFFLNHDATVLDLLNQFNIFTHVPLSSSASYTDIARATNLPEAAVRRILRYAFTMRFFAPDPTDQSNNRVVHTAFSAHAARSPALRAWFGIALDETRPATVHTAEALRRFSAGRAQPSEELDETPFSLWWPPREAESESDYWEARDDPKEAWRAKRFAEAMQASVGSAIIQADDVVNRFDWGALGKAKVVDVGGSDGALAAVLARKHPLLHFVVQDLPHIKTDFQTNLPADLAATGRIQFEGHDFFQPQPQTAGTDVFILKHVLHNWPDKHAAQILRNLQQNGKGGSWSRSRILICDSVVPSEQEAHTLPLSVRKGIAGADMQMLVMLNASERTVDDWSRLAQRADPRLRLEKVHQVPGAMSSLLELVLDEGVE